MIDVYSRRHLEQRACDDADQAEFTALRRKSAVLDSGIFDDRVAGALDDFDPDQAANLGWHRQDLQYDTAVGLIHSEIERRIRTMGMCYPFALQKNHITYKESKNLVYEFCLAICCSRSMTSGDYVELPRTFERVTTLLVKGYLGGQTEALHTGSPRDPAVGTTFQKAMARLHELSGEWTWGPDKDLPLDPTTTGDEGVDFVAWKTSPDKRPGQLFVLGQCACGDDWVDKFGDLSLERLRKWFSPPWYAKPVRAFAMPRHLSDGHLLNVQREAGLVFDRARLVILAHRLDQDAMLQDLIPQLKRLIELVSSGPVTDRSADGRASKKRWPPDASINIVAPNQ